MSKLHDLTGKQFGRLTVLEIEPKRIKSKVYWKAQCSCGNIISVVSGGLVTGNYKSCGCLKKDNVIARNKANVKPEGSTYYCFDCNAELTKDNWWPSWQKNNISKCISCGRKQNRKNDTKDKSKNRGLRNKYGISLEIFNAMMCEQNNACAICGIKDSEYKKRFHVDHCHTTGKVRGLLCNGCNIGLGAFKDNTKSLRSAINYLNEEGDSND